MGKKRKQLSQEEIWDDTELLDSWHEAKLEYQLYHSIDARGERVEDVLRQEEAADGLKLDTDANDTVDNAQPSSVQQEGLADIGMEDGEGNGLSPRVSATEQIEDPSHSNTTEQAIPCIPQALANSVPDESLKNLMMSWYYAGYYTGYYEGQKQAQNPMRPVSQDANQTAG